MHFSAAKEVGEHLQLDSFDKEEKRQDVTFLESERGMAISHSLHQGLTEGSSPFRDDALLRVHTFRLNHQQCRS